MLRPNPTPIPNPNALPHPPPLILTRISPYPLALIKQELSNAEIDAIAPVYDGARALQAMLPGYHPCTREADQP